MSVKTMRKDDWGLAVSLRGISQSAIEALMWLGDRDGHKINTDRNVDTALQRVRDYATEIESHWNRRQANNMLTVSGERKKGQTA